MPKMVAFTYLYDPDSGEGVAIKWRRTFQMEGRLFKADVLKDALGDVQQAYDAAVTAFMDEMEAERRAAQGASKAADPVGHEEAGRAPQETEARSKRERPSGPSGPLGGTD